MPNKIIGFSKLSRVEKIDWLSKNILDDSHQVKLILDKYLNSNKDIQAIHDSFSESELWIDWISLSSFKYLFKILSNSSELSRKFLLIQLIFSSLESFEKPIILSGIIFFTLCKYK